jgi:hypothetical protein
MDHGPKAAKLYVGLIKEAVPVNGVVKKKRSFAIATAGGHSVLLIAKTKPSTTVTELTKMSRSMGTLKLLASGEVEYSGGQILLKALHGATESTVKTAFLEYFQKNEAQPPTRTIKILQPVEWKAVEFDDTEALNEPDTPQNDDRVADSAPSDPPERGTGPRETVADVSPSRTGEVTQGAKPTTGEDLTVLLGKRLRHVQEEMLAKGLQAELIEPMKHALEAVKARRPDAESLVADLESRLRNGGAAPAREEVPGPDPVTRLRGVQQLLANLGALDELKEEMLKGAAAAKAKDPALPQLLADLEDEASAIEGLRSLAEFDLQPIEVWDAARGEFDSAVETVDRQISELQSFLATSNDDELEYIAELGLNAMSKDTRVPLMAALLEAGRGNANKVASATGKLLSKVAAFRTNLTNPVVEACDQNPFGVTMSVRATYEGALDQLAHAARMVRRAAAKGAN